MSQTPVEPLERTGVARLRLPWDSRFNATTLDLHLAEYPGFAFSNPTSGEYIVGGYWRGRRDIGMIIETSNGRSRGVLVAALLTRFRTAGLPLAVLSQDEVDAAGAWYREQNWTVLDRLLVYRLNLSRLDLTHRRPIPASLFQTEDIDLFVELDREAFPWLWQNEPADFLAYTASPNVAAFIARQGNRPLGYVSYSVRKDRGHLDRLAVHPRFAKQGYGSALLALALKRMQECGVREVGLTTQKGNRWAQEVYRHYGFAMTGEGHDIYGMKLSTLECL